MSPGELTVIKIEYVSKSYSIYQRRYKKEKKDMIKLIKDLHKLESIDHNFTTKYQQYQSVVCGEK